MEETNDQSTPNLADRKKGGRVWMLGLMIPATVLLPLWFFFIGPQLRHDRLVENGVQVQGLMIDVEETGTVVNDSPELEVTVAFTRKDGTLDTASCDFVPSRRSLHHFNPGVAVMIAYDPEDPEEITLVELNTATPTAPQVNTSAGTSIAEEQRKSDSLRKALEEMEARLKRLEEGLKK